MSKATDFCSAVIKSRHAHFACTKKAVAIYEKRGFCERHAPAFKPFFVYRVSSRLAEEIDKVLVYQHPDRAHNYVVVSPQNKGSTLWASNWYRSRKAAAEAVIKEAVSRVRCEMGDVRDAQRALRKLQKLALK